MGRACLAYSGCRRREVDAGHKKTRAEEEALKIRCSYITSEASTFPFVGKQLKENIFPNRVSFWTFVYRTIISVY